jgi:RNA polymerase sigma-70 factor, ECF subfamily
VAEPALSELVRASRAGDRDAFAAIYDRFHRAVHAIALARVRWSDADDVVQDVFLVAWQRLHELAEPAAFPGWLMTIARHRATDRVRREKKRAVASEEVVPPVPGAEAREALAAIAALPIAYRETLLMRLVEGMSGPEIAARTGLEPGSVRVNLHRGMALLRERLGLTVRAEAVDD